MTVLLWTPGCGRDRVPESGNGDGVPDDPSPSQAFFQLEDRLVQARDHDFSQGTPGASPGAGQPLSFAITVAGEPAGHAVLEIGPGGLPLERRQTVLFPSGEMRVVERYFSMSISP